MSIWVVTVDRDDGGHSVEHVCTTRELAWKRAQTLVSDAVEELRESDDELSDDDVKVEEQDTLGWIAVDVCGDTTFEVKITSADLETE